MPPSQTAVLPSDDDLVQALCFFSRPKLFKLMFVCRLFAQLIEDCFPSKPFAQAILRIWTEECEEEEEVQQQNSRRSRLHIYAGIAILDVKEQMLVDKWQQRQMMKTRKWQWWLNEDDEELDAKNLAQLQTCQRIVQFYQHRNCEEINSHSLCWVYDEEEECFVTEYYEEVNGEHSRKSQSFESERSCRELCEHVVSNKFQATPRCPLSTSICCRDGEDDEGNMAQKLQNFLDMHLNNKQQLQFIRLISIDISAANGWRTKNNNNNWFDRDQHQQQQQQANSSTSSELHELPVEHIQLQFDLGNISKNYHHCFSPALAEQNISIILPSPKPLIKVVINLEKNIDEIVDFIYHSRTNFGNCTVQLELTKIYMEIKSSFVGVRYIHELIQQLLVDFLLAKHCLLRYSCNFLIHPSFISDILLNLGNHQLEKFDTEHRFRRFFYEGDPAFEDLYIKPEIRRQQNSNANANEHYDYLFCYSFYDCKTNECWQLYWTLLDDNLCQFNISQHNAERDAEYHEELTKELNSAVGRMSLWISLQDAVLKRPFRPHGCFQRIGPYLHSENVLKVIEDRTEIEAQISRQTMLSG